MTNNGVLRGKVEASKSQDSFGMFVKFLVPDGVDWKTFDYNDAIKVWLSGYNAVDIPDQTP